MASTKELPKPTNQETILSQNPTKSTTSDITLNPETFDPQTSPEVTSPAEMPEIREKHRINSDGDLLIQAKRIYESWVPEDHYGVTCKQALDMKNRDAQNSRLVDSPKKIEEIKNAVDALIASSQNPDLTPLKLYQVEAVVNNYDDDILIEFGNNHELRLGFLTEVLQIEEYSGPNNYQKRNEYVRASITDKTAYRYQKNDRTNIQENRQLEKKRSPEIVDFTNESFAKKFELAQSFQEKYKQRRTLSKYLPLFKAIRLTHPNYKNFEVKPNFYDRHFGQKLTSWFEENLPKIGINDIKDIDYESFLPFLQANPDIVTFFDYQPSDTKLDETAFRLITSNFPGEYNFEIQKLISQTLIDIPFDKRPNNEDLKNLFKDHKQEITKETNLVIRNGLIIALITGKNEVVIPTTEATNTLKQVNQQTTPISTEKSTSSETMKVEIPKLWLDSKYEIDQKGQDVLEKIFSGKDPYEIAKEKNMTTNEVVALLSKFWKTKHLIGKS